MSSLCRLMLPNEFTNEFQSYVMETFFQSEPMNQCLQTKIPDEIDLCWLEQVLFKAKFDQLTLAFYDSNFSNNLPIAYSINHHDQIHDDNVHSDVLYSSLNRTSLHKYDQINNLISKLHENINLFEQFQCEHLFHIYFLGVHPNYRQNRLASQLIQHSISLAKDKHFDLIYADATSIYSTNAFLRNDFQILKTIDYASYENSSGDKIFRPIQNHKGCSIVLKDLRNQ